jgi:dUTP pyrophosphatase
MDLFSIEEVVLRPHVPVLVKTGLRMELPAGVQAEVRSRSGFALKEGVCVFNSPGTIDPGYRGDVGVILVWSGMTFNRMDGTGEMGFEKLIPAGSRVAQIVFMPYLAPDVEVAVDGESLSDSDRGEGGFGSTGV